MDKFLKYIIAIALISSMVVLFLTLRKSFLSMNSFPGIYGFVSSIVIVVCYFLIKQKTRATTTIAIIAILLTLPLSAVETWVENGNSRQIEEEFKLSVDNKTISLGRYKMLQGDSTMLPDIGQKFSNKYTIINFWAPWCPPCLKEMPIMESFYQEFKNNNVLIVGITGYYRKQDREEKEKYMTWVNSTLNNHNFSYPIIFDVEAAMAEKFKISSLPLTVLLDDQSRIIEYRVGIKGAELILDRIIEELDLKNTNN